ncbi:MAG: hypothetical protein AAF602_02255 [Myxococcota bacterium]
MTVLVDLWAETGRSDWATRARVFLFERPKQVHLLFARMPGTVPSAGAQQALRERLDASEALFFGMPVEAVTARFEVAWRTGKCRFDQDMRLRLDGSFGIDWLQPSRYVEWLGCGAGVPLSLPPDRPFLAELSRLATQWVADGCPGHAESPDHWFEDWGDRGGVQHTSEAIAP